MELFKLLGTIVIDSAEALKALKNAQQEGEKTESKLGKVFSGIGKASAACGKAIMVGLGAGATAMAGLTMKALSASGELEQNLGGAEAVFGDLGASIDKMSTKVITGYDKATGKAITETRSLEKESKDAYKNMGLSQSDYLATANKMGALFKGAGFETQEALDLSSQAMQRAADVASIMGIDTESAMEAVAGAAKGNFTMMDNLGVAMNDTAIAAYAASKGIKKSTSEMSQQEKIGLAMEMFLEKTSYAAGNYAKENETLAGSLSTAKAAFTNFLAGSGDVDSLVSSFSNLANVVVKSLKEIAPRLTTGLTDLVNQVMPLIPPLLDQLLPVLVEGATTLINGLVGALPGIISAILDVLPLLIDGIMQIVDALVGALPGIMQALVDALPTLMPALIDGIISMALMLVEMLPQIIQPLIDSLPTIIISIVEALVGNLPALIEGAIQLIMGIVTALPQIIQALVGAIPTIVSLLVEAILNNLPALIMGLVQVTLGIVAALPQILGSLISAIPAALKGIWDGIKNVFSGLGGWFGEKFSGAKEAAVNAWSDAKEKWNGIKEKVSGAWSDLKTKFGTKFSEAKKNAEEKWADAKAKWSGIKEKVVSGFSDLKSKVGNKFNEAKTNAAQKWADAKSKFSSVKDKVVSAFSDLGSKVSPLFSKAKDNATKTWSNVKSIFNKFKTGDIVGAFNDLGSLLKGKFSGALNAAKQGFSKIKQIGKDLVSGLWNGITNKFSWLTGKIKGFAKNVTDKLKGFFGIKSPSRVMRDEVGRFLAEGVAEGIDLNADKAESAAEKMGNAIIKAAEERLDRFKTTNNMTLAEEAAYWDEVRKLCNEGTSARLDADKKYLEAKKSLDNELLAAEEELQTSLTDIQNKLTDRKQSILDSFSLFDDEDESSFDLGLNLFSQVKNLEEYQSRIDALQSRIEGTSLYEEVKNMGLDGFKYVGMLNAMSDAELQNLVSLHEKRSELAESLARDELGDTVLAETQKAYQTFADKCAELGVEVVNDTEAMESGIDTAFADITKTVETATSSIAVNIGEKITAALDSLADALARLRNAYAETNATMGTASFSVNNTATLQNPAIFGYDTASGFVGNSTDSASGENSLVELVKAAVAEQNSTMARYLQKIIEVLGAYFPQLIEAFDVQLRLDTGVLVGELVEPMNEALGKLSSRKDRGR